MWLRVPSSPECFEREPGDLGDFCEGQAILSHPPDAAQHLNPQLNFVSPSEIEPKF